MIENLSRLRDPGLRRVDLCIIGAGAAGITIAQELIGSRLSVCLVEAGGFEVDDHDQALYDAENVGFPAGLDYGRLRMFGGTTNHWSGRCAPLDPLDFEKRDWIPDSGWPIARRDLDPYYLRAQPVCGFDRPWPSDDELLRVLDISMPEFATPWLRRFIWRYARTEGRTPWNWGAGFRPALERAANIQVLLHANAVAFESDPGARQITALTVRSLDGNSCRIEADRYVLCCGGVENARLLLVGNEHAPEGFGNRHDMVGRFFGQHLRGRSAVLLPSQPMSPIQEMTGMFTLPGDWREIMLGMALSEQAQREHGLLNASATVVNIQDPISGWAAGKAIVNHLLAGSWPPGLGEKIGRVALDLGSLGTNLDRRIRYGKRAMVPLLSTDILVDVEQMPDRDSRVTLSDRRDVLGMRQARLDWRLSDLERRTAERFSTFLAADFALLGLGRVRQEPWLDPAVPFGTKGVEETYHHIGSTRMAADARQGVVDADCRVHGMCNLFVAGSSVFPTGGHANPTFTIVALALRLADHLKA